MAPAGCGYAVGPGAADPLGPFTVEARPGLVPDASAIAAAEAAARAELARAGLLAPPGCRRCARIAIEVSAVREGPSAIGLAPGAADPVARSLEIVVTGRALLLPPRGLPPRGDARDPGAPGRGGSPRGGPLRRTADLEITERIAWSPDPTRAALGRDVAARRAASRLGRGLAARLIGRPTPSERIAP